MEKKLEREVAFTWNGIETNMMITVGLGEPV